MSSSSLVTSALTTESWFIPIDIIMLLCTILTIILAIIFLFIVILDKACHTVSMMLISNSCISILVFTCVLLSMCIFTLENDFKQIIHQDSLCLIRAYFGYVAVGTLYFSFLIQALYRFIVVIYPTRLFWQSTKFQFLMIFLTWMIGFIYPTVFTLSGIVAYNSDNQLCQIPIRPSFFIVYSCSCIYFISVTIIMFVYFKLLRYVHAMKNHVIPVNTLIRAQKELKMTKRIVILIATLLTLGFPYALFILMSFFTSPPKYSYRIAFLFVDTSLVAAMLILFQFTDPVKSYIIKIMKQRSNTVIATMT
ncbi:unnamed protein product [Adineta steineri]|uniref:G-protein coupled receptors family 1 profile domain-containing protein n=1 Tax=Adineta steineri TaxID=433720 RepID=A0A819MRG2_9BILA|nr:unnamed protein product [Adineta steineri]CAF1493826.1 unnamed protein product [Adineta steineri]CAF3886184.1 unnamed protein product [Adineta steineri]CAF3985270.1 unnamed protein product [Adineta steineri]